MRVLLRLAPGLLLFTRIRREQILEHSTRARIFDLIQRKPGVHFRELGRGAGVANGVLTHHLVALEREELVRRRRAGTRVCFYPSSRPIARRLRSLPAALLQAVSRRPGIGQSDVARMLGLSRQALHYHIKQAVDRGFLASNRQGRASVLHLTRRAQEYLASCPGCNAVYEDCQHGMCLACNKALQRLGS